MMSKIYNNQITYTYHHNLKNKFNIDIASKKKKYYQH